MNNESKTKVVYALVLKRQVSVPRGENYHAKLVEIAGGDYVFKDLKGKRYVKINAEELINRTANADVYIAIYMGMPVNSKQDLIKEIPGLAETKPFKEDRIYAMQPWIWQHVHRWMRSSKILRLYFIRMNFRKISRCSKKYDEDEQSR